MQFLQLLVLVVVVLMSSVASQGFGGKEGAVSMLKAARTKVINTPKATCGNKPSTQEVVIGLASGYSWGQVSKFVLSLRNNGYTGDIVIGTNPNIPPDLRTQLDEHCVIAVAVKLDTSYLPKMPVASRRFVLYKYWLDDLGFKQDARVLLIDVRDSIFQRSPFVDWDKYVIPPVDLLLFSDNHPLLKDVKYIGNVLREGYVDFHTYMTNCYPKQEVEAIGRAAEAKKKGTLMLCSGTTMGTKVGIDKYLTEMKKSFEEYDCWPSKGQDQGYHNWIYFKGLLPTAKVYDPFEGPLLTAGSVADFTKLRVPDVYRDVLRRDNLGYLVNKDGTVVPSIHQWDRIGGFLQGGGWMMHAIVQKKTAAQIAALGVQRASYIEWRDGCTHCPEGNQGCFLPVRTVKVANCGTGTSMVVNCPHPKAVEVNRNPKVAHGAGVVCQGAAVDPAHTVSRLQV
jgi:hypothetical protein